MLLVSVQEVAARDARHGTHISIRPRLELARPAREGISLHADADEIVKHIFEAGRTV
jgi:hypothetical protein